MRTEIEETFTLEINSELRFLIDEKDARVYIKLKSGFAEMFGTKLVLNKTYEFKRGSNVAIFTHHGCTISIQGKTDFRYVSKNTPVRRYLDFHHDLEDVRVKAERTGSRGPIAMVVGPADVGKSTLCRILLNYAVRAGRKPIYADVDVDQGSVSVPGTIGSMVIEQTASIEHGFSQQSLLAFHYGYKSPNDNKTLYKNITSKMAEVTLRSMAKKKWMNTSGMIINTCSWMQGECYSNLLHCAQAFEASTVFVLHQEQLYHDFVRDLAPNVKVILLPKSGGVIPRSKSLRCEARDLRVRNIMYGSRMRPYPFSFEVKWADVRIYKIETIILPDSRLPVEMKPDLNITRLVTVPPSAALIHRLLSISFIVSTNSSDENIIGRNVVGFICITDVDPKRQTMTVLSTQPQLLPYKFLLLSDIQFANKH